MKLTNLKAFNFEGAFRGMRSPLESWKKSDSFFDINCDECTLECSNCQVLNGIGNIIGPNDLNLAQKLILAGSEHRKFLRQIIVSFDLTAPLYFWKEFDTYKIGTVANSTSTMHKIATTPITLDCFETDDFDEEWLNNTGVEAACDTWVKNNIIYFLETLRKEYIKTKNKKYWKELIRWLPESWLQTRTITMSYENIFNIIRQRSNHKLSEWNWLIEQFKQLPYSHELLYNHIKTEDSNED